MSANKPECVCVFTCDGEGQGVVGAFVRGSAMPLMTTRESIARGEMMEIARRLSEKLGLTIRLYRVTVAEEIEVITPKATKH